MKNVLKKQEITHSIVDSDAFRHAASLIHLRIHENSSELQLENGMWQNFPDPSPANVKLDISEVKHVFMVNMCLLVSLTLHLFRFDGRRTSH